MMKKGFFTVLSAVTGVLLMAGLVSIGIASFKKEVLTLPVYDQLGGDFTLESTDEIYNSMSTAQGKVVILSFGFTSCPDICPMMLEKYRRIYKSLDNIKINGKKASDQVVMYFVSVDPERDTLKRMSKHFKSFDTRIIGLRGSEQQIEQVQASVALASRKMPKSGRISHSERILLFDAEGRLRAMPSFRDPLSDFVGMIEALLEENTQNAFLNFLE